MTRGEALAPPRACRTIEVDGRAIETRSIAGRIPGAPTLVLLHEGLGCVALWRDFPERLATATGCGVFAYSRLGYGGSDPRPLPWPRDYMQQEGREGLGRVLAAAGIDTCVLFGHSDGASIALVHAGSARDSRVKGVIVMAPHVFTEAAGLASIRMAQTAFVTGNLRARLAKYHGANVDCAFRGWCDSWLHPDFVHWNIEAFLGAIQVPLLQIQGEDDQYGSVAQLEAIARQVAGPVDTHVLAACRHAPHVEQPERTLALVKDFVFARIQAGEKDPRMAG
ncbi:MAG: alpha/beta fold hydrolase [Gammaproteobacteria bacterium]